MSSRNSSSSSSGGMGCGGFFLALLQVSLIVLKLTGFLETWSWLAVFMPTIFLLLFTISLFPIAIFLWLLWLTCAYLVFTTFSLLGKHYSSYERYNNVTLLAAYKTSNFLKNTFNLIINRKQIKFNKKLDDLIKYHKENDNDSI